MSKFLTSLMIVIFFLFILVWKNDDHPVSELRKQLNLTKAAPIIVIHADPRSLTARRFVEKIEANLNTQDTKLTLAIKSTNSSSFKDLAPTSRWISEPLGWPMKANSFSVYLQGIEPVLKGDVFSNPNEIVNELNILTGVQEPFELGEYLEMGSNIESTPFYSAVKNLPIEPISAFVVFQDICMTCNSGRILMEIEKLKQKLPSVSFTYLTVANYTQEQINHFAQNHELTVPIYAAGRTFREYWQGLGFPQGHHPLDGLVFVISAEGQVLFAGNIADPEPFRRWLKIQSGNNIKKGDKS